MMYADVSTEAADPKANETPTSRATNAAFMISLTTF